MAVERFHGRGVCSVVSPKTGGIGTTLKHWGAQPRIQKVLFHIHTLTPSGPKTCAHTDTHNGVSVKVVLTPRPRSRPWLHCHHVTEFPFRRVCSYPLETCAHTDMHMASSAAREGVPILEGVQLSLQARKLAEHGWRGRLFALLHQPSCLFKRLCGALAVTGSQLRLHVTPPADSSMVR